MSKLPFMRFFPADWIQDTQVLTLEGQGAWVKVICGLHVSPTYGKRIWTRPELTVFLGIQDEEQLDDLLVQLARVSDMEIRDVDENVTEIFSNAFFIEIICRRMVREKKQREQWVKDQSAHRQKNVSQKSGRLIHNSLSEVISEEDSFKKKSPDRRASPGPSQAKQKRGNGKAGLDPSVKLWADAIYESDPEKFGRLVTWIKAAERTYSPVVVARTLQAFLPRCSEISEWWGYLDKILEKEEGRAHGSDSESESDRIKRDEGEWVKREWGK